MAGHNTLKQACKSAKEKPTYSFKITFSLRRSKIRREVLKFLLCAYPRSVHLSEIAKAIGARPDQVLFALKGYSDRYKKDLSLLNLGLVRCVVHSNLKLYIITELGIRALLYNKDICTYLQKRDLSLQS